MTDRSSEERSREWKPLVEVIRREMLARFSDKLSMEEIASCAYAVAALEDRQEAAPTKDTTKSICGCIMCDFHVSAAEIRDRESDASWALGAFQSSSPGVPSEATPSKENAPECPEREIPRAKDSRLQGKKYLYPEAAPVPEVQGTPKFNLEESLAALQKLQEKFAAENPDIVAAASARGTDGGSGMAAQNSPVGTPQKETPPMKTPRRSNIVKCFSCDEWYQYDDGHKCEPAPAPEVQGTPRSLGKLIHDATIQRGGEFVVTSEEFEIMCAATPGPQAVGASLFCGKKLRIESPVGTSQKETPPKQCTWVDRMDFTGGIQCNFQRGHKGRHSFEKAAPIPEGVQGKEPQTPEEWKSDSAEKAVCEWIVVQHRPKEIAEFMPILIAMRDEIFVFGEAAGRRSAITEMKEWANAKYEFFNRQCLDYCPEEHYQNMSEWCTELQEKTK